MRTRLLALLFSVVFIGIGMSSFAQRNQRSLKNLTIGIRHDNVTIYVNLNGKVVGFNTGEEDFNISYYDKFDGQDKVGKLKAIGDLKLDYYDRFNLDELNGKLKSVGSVTLEYHDRFDMSAPKGKLKTAGSLKITYYDRFDGSDLEGRIKSISGANKNVFVK